MGEDHDHPILPLMKPVKIIVSYAKMMARVSRLKRRSRPFSRGEGTGRATTRSLNFVREIFSITGITITGTGLTRQYEGTGPGLSISKAACHPDGRYDHGNEHMGQRQHLQFHDTG